MTSPPLDSSPTRPARNNIVLIVENAALLFVHKIVLHVREQWTCRRGQRTALLVFLSSTHLFRVQLVSLSDRCDIKPLVVAADKKPHRRVAVLPVRIIHDFKPYLGVTQKRQPLKGSIEQT